MSDGIAAVLGAGGTIAPAIVRDLAESPEVSELRLLDLDGERAAAVAQAHGGGRATAAGVDARDTEAVAGAIAGADVLLNAASYRVNLEAMRACLRAGADYIDLGGLYRMTVRQLELDGEFRDAGRLGILGMGAAPGKSNVMAARAVAELDGAHAVHCASSGRDLDPPEGLSAPYAIQTLIDELTIPPVVVRSGKPTEVAPLTDGGEIDFLEPIGRRPTIYTLHSETLNFPASFHCAESSFRLALGPGVLDKLKPLIGLPPEEIAALRPEPPSSKTYSGQWVEASGTREGEPRTVTVRALTVPNQAWGLGGGIVSTASPAAAAVRLVLRGALEARGAMPPEQCIAPALLFAELGHRGTTFEVSINGATVARP